MCVCPCVAPVEKLFRLVIIKEVKGSQVAAQLQSSVRDKLSYADKYEDEEEEDRSSPPSRELWSSGGRPPCSCYL